ncbi:MAG: AAA family ATPase [Planctomycetes bacterium]|nr:AAA family ATPase [Planctomycetota bacterium]
MIETLLEALALPGAYPYPVDAVELRQTHISAVFLAGAFVYKIKKPVNLGFLDFSTLEKRKHFCEEEVRLNRRLAPHVYIGVVPIRKDASGLNFEGKGEAVEWAVKMVRLPDDATLESRLLRGEVQPTQIQALARKLASFHNNAEGGLRIAEFGRFEVVAKNLRENFSLSEAQVGVTVSASVFQRFRELTDEHLERNRALIDARAKRGIPRDTHGDLHLDHLYSFPDRSPPKDLVIIDCIEFNERYRYADPVADMAFVVMDLAFHGRRDLGKLLARTYFDQTGDREGQTLLPLYVSYRAAVRGKVDGLKSFEKEVPATEKDQARASATAHWLLGLWELEEPARRSALILISGLPGTGKSTLADDLSQQFNAVWLRSDVIRKELIHGDPVSTRGSKVEEGIYSPEATARTYHEMQRRATEAIWQGRRVIVDANFRLQWQRRLFFRIAKDRCVPCLFLNCEADAQVIRERLRNRRGDVSDADWSIYEYAAATSQAFDVESRRHVHLINANTSLENMVQQAVAVLAGAELAQ